VRRHGRGRRVPSRAVPLPPQTLREGHFPLIADSRSPTYRAMIRIRLNTGDLYAEGLSASAQVWLQQTSYTLTNAPIPWFKALCEAIDLRRPQPHLPATAVVPPGS
jgi:hypothetical protein